MSGQGHLRLVLTLALALACLAAPATAAAHDGRLHVYDVVIDGFDPAYLTPVTAPNLSALLGDSGSTWYPAARAVMASETNPNHVAMVTGAYPDASGFVGNAWFDRTTGRQTSGEDPSYLDAETIFTAIREARPAGASRPSSAAIFGKPKLGRIFANGRSTRTGADHFAPDYLWIPCRSGAPSGATCGDVPTNPATGYALDDSVMDEAIRTVDRLDPNYVFVNLPDVDSAGHGFTPLAPIYPAAIARADLLVGRLVRHLKDTGRWSSSVLVVHADHGMNATPVRIHLASAFQRAGLSGLDVTGNGGLANVTLIDAGRPDANQVLAQARQVALAQPGVEQALYRSENPLDSGATLAAVRPAWHYGDARAGDLVVTADAEAAFSDGSPSFPFNPLPGNHGHPSTRAIPFLVAGGASVLTGAGRVPPSGPESEGDDTAALPEQAENIDVAPTVAALLGVPAPSHSAGRVLLEALSPVP